MGRGALLIVCAALWGCPAYLLSGIPAGKPATDVVEVAPMEPEAALLQLAL